MKDTLMALKDVFEAELKSAFGKFNLILAIIALALALGLPTLGLKGIDLSTHLLTIMFAIYMGYTSFGRTQKRMRRQKVGVY